MKRKGYVTICAILTAAALIFLLYQSRNNSDRKEEACRSVDKSQETETAEPEEKRREKIELMDYVGLSVEEFMEKTGIPLSREDENTWNTESAETFWYPENASVWLMTDHDRIVYLSVFLRNTEPEFAEAFPYTVAGIRMGMTVSYYRETLLKDASVRDISYNSDCYTNLKLSMQGIEQLRLTDDGGIVGMVEADIDLSLKENTENLKYVWEERVIQKEGRRNDRLKAAGEPYTRFPESRENPEAVDETFVWIRYPYLAIPGRPEMEKNANEVIAEAVKKIEENTYGSTDENIVVDAEYCLSYVTSRFISIAFYVYVTDGDGRKPLWQYCNINMGENGRKAYLSDLGISREEVEERCNAGHELGPVDTESCLESYDTNWDQYYIDPTEYVIIVKPLYEDEGNWQYGENTTSLAMSKPYGMGR